MTEKEIISQDASFWVISQVTSEYKKLSTRYLTVALGILLFFLFVCGPMNNVGIYK